MNELQGEKSWTYFTDWSRWTTLLTEDCKYICEYGICVAAPSGTYLLLRHGSFVQGILNEIWDIVLEDDITIQDCIGEQDLCMPTVVCQLHGLGGNGKARIRKVIQPEK